MVQFAVPKHTGEFAHNSVLMMCSEESKHHRRASWELTLTRLMEKFGEEYTMEASYEFFCDLTNHGEQETALLKSSYLVKAASDASMQALGRLVRASVGLYNRAAVGAAQSSQPLARMTSGWREYAQQTA